MNEETALIKKTLITDLVGAYRIAEGKIRVGMNLLVEAESGLKEVFGDRSRASFELGSLGNFHDYVSLSEPDKIMKKLKIQAWRVLVERMELRRFLSISAGEKLDQQLEIGADLPEIDEAQILAMMEGTLESLNGFVEEAIKEVYDWMRPRQDRYKTNDKFAVGERVVLEGCLEGKFGGGFRLSYYRQKNLTALDRVFHALDGNMAKFSTYQGPLCDSIDGCKGGHGETPYFEFRCYHNRNLHIRFKRMDLVTRLNAVAGGDKLKPEMAAA